MSRLYGWKAIADYLGRSVRTAQRWHRDRGLPVHRVPGQRGGAFVTPEELDTWLHSAEQPGGDPGEPELTRD